MKVKAVILAAGKGTRMKSDLPKVLHPLLGRPLLSHVIENIRSAGITDITVVVGYEGDSVINAIGSGVNYVWQREQLGTGHAVLMAKDALADFDGGVLIACGDAPLVSPQSFRNLEFDSPELKGSVLTMIAENPHGYGRIVRGNSGVSEIVEEKDASDEQRTIKEVNTGTYIFDSKLLFEALSNIGNSNAQNEYYLPDVVKYINAKGYAVQGIVLDDPVEGSGVNSPEELARLESRMTVKG